MAIWQRWLGIVAVLGGLGTGAEADTLKVFGDDKYPPVVHLQDGKPAGFLVDILRRAEALTGDRYDIELVPWKRALELAKRGDGGLMGVSWTAERAEWFDYSAPLFNDDIHVVTLKSKAFKLTQLADLKGKTLGGVTGASYGDEVDRAIADGLFRVERDIGVTSRLRKLLRDHVDGALVGNGRAGFEAVLASHPELSAQRAQFVWLPTPVARDRLFLAFPKGMKQQAALARLNAALPKLEGVRPPKATP
jgi:polar amino acid transport system substrate-binding protein